MPVFWRSDGDYPCVGQQSHGGKMPEGYLHLTCEQRCQIYALLQSGHSQAHIARTIGVDPSTISRELVRNAGARGYRFKQAQEKASQRRKEASDKPRKMTPDLVELVGEKLTQEQWSPDQISGRLAKDGVAFISHERIYQHVWKDKKDGGKLYLHLRHSGKKYNKRKGKNSGRGLIPNRVDIDQRPSVVAAKSPIGDWEADKIIGANHRGAVMSHVERKSKYTKLAKLPDKTADSVVQACARGLFPLADRIETITSRVTGSLLFFCGLCLSERVFEPTLWEAVELVELVVGIVFRIVAHVNPVE